MVPFPTIGRRRADTVEQLRGDIDSGRMRDKIRVGDPAAAPLGADEEAAGTPLPSAAIARARQTERDRGSAVGSGEAGERSRRRRWTVAAFAALAVLAALSVWMAP